jgi:hypothetical protein
MTTRLATIPLILFALQSAAAAQKPAADRAANPGSLRQIIPVTTRIVEPEQSRAHSYLRAAIGSTREARRAGT